MDRSAALKLVAIVGLCIVFGFGSYFVARRADRDPVEPASAAQDSAAPVDPHDPNYCQKCEAHECPVLVDECKSPECKAALACFWKNKCSPDEDHLYNCYCGATTKEDCFLGKAPPQGACAKELKAAAHTDSALETGRRFFDRDSPEGQAMQVAACVLRNCPGCP